MCMYFLFNYGNCMKQEEPVVLYTTVRLKYMFIVGF